jgi:hypothetical protein
MALLISYSFILSASNVNAQSQDEQEARQLLQLTFDNDIPGTARKQWKKIWGNMGQDTMNVANINAINEQNNHVVIKRENTFDSAMAPHWGAGVYLKKWKSPWLEVQMAFRHSGPLVDHVGQFELFGMQGQRLYAVSLGSRSSNGKVGFKCYSDSIEAVSLSKVEAEQWYRLTVRVPAPETKASKSYCMLQHLDENGQWVELGDVAEGTVAKLPLPVMTVRLSLPPGELNARYELAVEQTPQVNFKWDLSINVFCFG